MKVYIVTFHDESFGNDDAIIVEKCLSTKEKAEQYIREMYKLTEDTSIHDFSQEMYDLSGTILEIRECKID